MPSIEHLIEAADIQVGFIFSTLSLSLKFNLINWKHLQKLLFYDSADGVAKTLRPYWAEAVDGRAGVVQAQPDMLEIVPLGTSKGSGVEILLDHLGTSWKEVCRLIMMTIF